MKTQKILLLAVGGIVAPLALQAQSVDGLPSNTYFEIGAIGQSVDVGGGTDFNGEHAGLFGAMQTSIPMGNANIVVDLQFEQMTSPDNNASWENRAPQRAGLSSLSYQRQNSDGSVFGGFAGLTTNDIVDGDGEGQPPLPNFMAGLQYMSGGAQKFFATIGLADIGADYSSDVPDGQFKGAFIDAGFTGNLSDKTVYKANLGYGYSNEAFEGDTVQTSAQYATIGVKLLHAMSENLYLTAGIDHMDYKAFKNADTNDVGADATRVSIGVVIPLGKTENPTVHALRPLAPNLAPVRAAGWIEVLDGAAVDIR